MMTAWILYLGFLTWIFDWIFMMTPNAASAAAFEDDPSATPERIEYSW
jgi:hypothetical protein